MNDFKASDVVFNEELHTYTRGEQQLSGITSLIHSVLRLGVYPKAEDKVKEILIPQAGYYGTCIHQAIQSWDELGIEMTQFPEKEHETAHFGVVTFPAQDVSADLAYYKTLLPEGWRVLANEFTVSYGDFASQIDIVWGDDEDGVWLVDTKSNNIDAYPGRKEGLKEYLSWQLSCYAFMFEHQTGLKVKGLKGNWMRKGTGEMWGIERKPDELVKKLLETTILPNPDYDPMDIESHRFIYINDEMQVAEEVEVVATPDDLAIEQDFIGEVVKILEYEAKAKELKERLRKEMEKHGVTKFECDQFSASIGKPSTREDFDKKKFQEENPELYEQYKKTTKVSGKFSLKLK